MSTPAAMMIDQDSRDERFNWSTIAGISFPHLFRYGKPHVSVHMLETKILSKYPHDIPDVLKVKPPLPSFHITEAEARLLNKIVLKYCKSQYGSKEFKAKCDLIIDVETFIAFFRVVKDVYPNVLIEGGWLQINNTAVPYVLRKGSKYLPFEVIHFAARLLDDTSVQTECMTMQEMEFLNNMCHEVGFTFRFNVSAQLVALAIVKSNNKVLSVKELPSNDPLNNTVYEEGIAEKSSPSKAMHQEPMASASGCSSADYFNKEQGTFNKEQGTFNKKQRTMPTSHEHNKTPSNPVLPIDASIPKHQNTSAYNLPQHSATSYMASKSTNNHIQKTSQPCSRKTMPISESTNRSSSMAAPQPTFMSNTKPVQQSELITSMPFSRSSNFQSSTVSSMSSNHIQNGSQVDTQINNPQVYPGGFTEGLPMSHQPHPPFVNNPCNSGQQPLHSMPQNMSLGPMPQGSMHCGPTPLIPSIQGSMPQEGSMSTQQGLPNHTYKQSFAGSTMEQQPTKKKPGRKRKSTSSATSSSTFAPNGIPPNWHPSHPFVNPPASSNWPINQRHQTQTFTPSYPYGMGNNVFHNSYIPNNNHNSNNQVLRMQQVQGFQQQNGGNSIKPTGPHNSSVTTVPQNSSLPTFPQYSSLPTVHQNSSVPTVSQYQTSPQGHGNNSLAGPKMKGEDFWSKPLPFIYRKVNNTDKYSQYASVEAVVKLCFDTDVTYQDFIDAMRTCFDIELEDCTDKEEQEMIDFYWPNKIPGETQLKCKKLIEREMLDRYFDSLTKRFANKKEPKKRKTTKEQVVVDLTLN